MHELNAALEAAVPFKIAEYEARGGPTDEDFRRARELGDELSGPAGSALLVRNAEGHSTAKLFNRVVDALAVLSFVPDGSRFGDTRWEGKWP